MLGTMLLYLPSDQSSPHGHCAFCEIAGGGTRQLTQSPGHSLIGLKTHIYPKLISFLFPKDRCVLCAGDLLLRLRRVRRFHAPIQFTDLRKYPCNAVEFARLRDISAHRRLLRSRYPNTCESLSRRPHSPVERAVAAHDWAVNNLPFGATQPF